MNTTQYTDILRYLKSNRISKSSKPVDIAAAINGYMSQTDNGSKIMDSNDRLNILNLLGVYDDEKIREFDYCYNEIEESSINEIQISIPNGRPSTVIFNQIFDEKFERFKKYLTKPRDFDPVAVLLDPTLGVDDAFTTFILNRMVSNNYHINGQIVSHNSKIHDGDIIQYVNVKPKLKNILIKIIHQFYLDTLEKLIPGIKLECAERIEKVHLDTWESDKYEDMKWKINHIVSNVLDDNSWIEDIDEVVGDEFNDDFKQYIMKKFQVNNLNEIAIYPVHKLKPYRQNDQWFYFKDAEDPNGYHNFYYGGYWYASSDRFYTSYPHNAGGIESDEAKSAMRFLDKMKVPYEVKHEQLYFDDVVVDFTGFEKHHQSANLISELMKGTIETDDDNKAKALSKQGFNVSLSKKGTSKAFNKTSTSSMGLSETEDFESLRDKFVDKVLEKHPKYKGDNADITELYTMSMDKLEALYQQCCKYELSEVKVFPYNVVYVPLKEKIDEVSIKTPWKVDPAYTHFAVRKSDNKILTGWEYDKDLDRTEIVHWCKMDLKDMNIPAKSVTILTVKGCKAKGINPFDSNKWRNYSDSTNLNESRQDMTQEQYRQAITIYQWIMLFGGANLLSSKNITNEYKLFDALKSGKLKTTEFDTVTQPSGSGTKFSGMPMVLDLMKSIMYSDTDPNLVEPISEDTWNSPASKVKPGNTVMHKRFNCKLKVTSIDPEDNNVSMELLTLGSLDTTNYEVGESIDASYDEFDKNYKIIKGNYRALDAEDAEFEEVPNAGKDLMQIHESKKSKNKLKSNINEIKISTSVKSLHHGDIISYELFNGDEETTEVVNREVESVELDVNLLDYIKDPRITDINHMIISGDDVRGTIVNMADNTGRITDILEDEPRFLFAVDDPQISKNWIQYANDIADDWNGSAMTVSDLLKLRVTKINQNRSNLKENASKKNKIRGGNGDKSTADMVNPYELRKGLRVEEEHTEDYEERLEIVLDHLSEDPAYYTHLIAMEDKYEPKKRTDLPIEIKGKKLNTATDKLKDRNNEMSVSVKNVSKKNAGDSLNKKEAAKGQPKGVKVMTMSPKKAKGITDAFKTPGKEKKIKLKESLVDPLNADFIDAKQFGLILRAVKKQDKPALFNALMATAAVSGAGSTTKIPLQPIKHVLDKWHVKLCDLMPDLNEGSKSVDLEESILTKIFDTLN